MKLKSERRSDQIREEVVRENETGGGRLPENGKWFWFLLKDETPGKE